GDARYQGVVADAAEQQLGASADDLRQVAGGVDAGIPGPGFERAQVGGAITAQLLDPGEELGRGAAAIEQRDPMPAAERALDQETPEETRAAEDQELHGIVPLGVLQSR